MRFSRFILSVGFLGAFAFGTTACDSGSSNAPAGGVSTTTTTGLTIDLFGSTSTTTLSTTTTSTTTSSTIMGDPAGVCEVTISVSSSETIASLQYNVDYTSVQPGSFQGMGSAVNCTNAPGITGSIVTHNDDDAAQTLRTGIISLSGFAGPTDIATCIYFSGPGSTEPVANDFVVTLVDAADPAFVPLTPTLALTVTNCVLFRR